MSSTFNIACPPGWSHDSDISATVSIYALDRETLQDEVNDPTFADLHVIVRHLQDQSMYQTELLFAGTGSRALATHTSKQKADIEQMAERLMANWSQYVTTQ